MTTNSYKHSHITNYLDEFGSEHLRSHFSLLSKIISYQFERIVNRFIEFSLKLKHLKLSRRERLYIRERE